MKYYVYFDSYGHARQVINDKELALKYGSDPDAYLKAAGETFSGSKNPCGGHVGTLKFDTEAELKSYLESLGDEIEGFYGCQSESRPYNF
jgi:hypothetical protein